MKRIYLFACMIVMGLGASAQINVSLRINHHLGAAPFQMGAQATNNLGNAFTLNRLEYYISEITLIHDGGQLTMVPSHWILVDASQPLMEDLGSQPITTLEGVRFGVGVEPAYNHLDPSSYAPTHPLYPQTPSMHWGWSSGYRFIAMEGNCGTSMVQTMEIHSLDDVNYFQTTINTAGTMTFQGLVIDVDADYAMGLKDIDLSSGVINHGATGSAQRLAQNFRDFVFSATVATGVTAPAAIATFDIAPNPTQGHTRLLLDAGMSAHSSFVVYDYTGRILKTVQPMAGIADLDLAAAGYYLVALQQGGHTVATKRLVVTR
jgi:hypothetical protein